jgi:AcrR family transcriptional regulator
MQKQVSPTEYRLQLRDRILKAATEEFFTRGIKAVKMDDIANKLAVSKRTLYEIYTNKEELLMETIVHHSEDFEREMLKFKGTELTVIDTLLHFYQLEIEELSRISPLYFSDLHKYPKVLKWLKDKHDETLKYRYKFFQKGIEQGFFRSDLEYPLLAQLADSSKTFIMKNKLYQKYSMVCIYRNVVLLYIRGLCTQKGIRILDDALEKLP